MLQTIIKRQTSVFPHVFPCFLTKAVFSFKTCLVRNRQLKFVFFCSKTVDAFTTIGDGNSDFEAFSKKKEVLKKRTSVLFLPTTRSSVFYLLLLSVFGNLVLFHHTVFHFTTTRQRKKTRCRYLKKKKILFVRKN